MVKNNKEEYRPNDLVFGQLRGYPWWPAYIMQREASGDYRVVFFGDFTYAILNGKKIRRFEANSRKFDKKNQKLTQAIKSALRVMRNESTIKIEKDAVLQHFVKVPTTKPKKPSKKKKKGDSRTEGGRQAEGVPGKTKKIKKDAKSRRKPNHRSSIALKKQKRVTKTLALELVNDTQGPSEIERLDKSQRESILHGDLLTRPGKMSMSLGGDEFRNANLEGAMSERAKPVQSQYFDEIVETKSVKPSDKTPDFRLNGGGEFLKPLEIIFDGGKQAQSGIDLLNQTKDSMRSFEKMNEMLRVADKKLQNEVIDLRGDDDSRISKSPSLSSKRPFSLKPNDLTMNQSVQSFGIAGKANFEKIEKEMQDLLDSMKKSKSTEKLGEKLKAWHKELKTKEDFKFIVGTNIGKYLSNMRDFCQKRLNETKHYDNVLDKIKAFENIIMDKISKTFFGQEQGNLTHLLKDQLSSIQNPSPASKDLTLLNQSFPSPRFESKKKFVLDTNIISGRRRSNVRQALLNEEKHHQPIKRRQKRLTRKLTDSMFIDCLDNPGVVQSSMNDLDLHNKTHFTEKMPRIFSEQVRMNQSLYCKMKKEATADFEDTSVVTMKRDNLEGNKLHWNNKDLIDSQTQKRVARKFAKKMLNIQVTPQMKSETVLKLGEIIEKALRFSVRGKEEYKEQVLDLMQYIEESGMDFYIKFLSQNQRRCDVNKLKFLLRERMRCN